MQGIERFSQRGPEVRVWLLDDGVLGPAYRQRYGSRYDFLPRVSPDEVCHLLWQAGVVVGLFAVGALGLSELQEMNCARHVIALFRYPAAYPESPPLYQSATAEEIDAHLETLFQYPEEARAMGERACAWVEYPP